MCDCPLQVLHSFRIASGSINTFEFHPNELVVAAATSERVVRIWDAERYEELACTSPESSPVKTLPDFHAFFFFWKLETFMHHLSTTTCEQAKALVYHPDGDLLISASQDSVRVLTGTGAQVLHHIESGWDRLSTCMLTNRSHLVGAGFQNTFVSVWDMDLSDLIPPRKMEKQAAKNSSR